MIEKIRLSQKTIKFLENQKKIIEEKLDKCTGKRQIFYLKDLHNLKLKMQWEIRNIENLEKEAGI
jgi:hypothetical protein